MKVPKLSNVIIHNFKLSVIHAGIFPVDIHFLYALYFFPLRNFNIYQNERSN